MPPSVAIWMYGSHARGDPDSDSDLDVLVVSTERIDTARVALWTGLESSLSTSQYSWPEIQGMAAYGSLFLHHIRLEGRRLVEGRLVEGRLQHILASLPDYKRAPLDLAAFQLTLNDVRESLRAGGSAAFEASILATVLRHASILGCYVSGFPSFGRIEPIRRVVDAWHLDHHIAEEFPKLYRYRIRADRNLDFPDDLGRAELAIWCDYIDRVLCKLEEQVRDYHTRMSPATGSCQGSGWSPGSGVRRPHAAETTDPQL
jgi:hypothetical protein